MCGKHNDDTRSQKNRPSWKICETIRGNKIAELHQLLAEGAPSRPDPRRPGFYEVEAFRARTTCLSIRQALKCCCSACGNARASGSRHGGVFLSSGIKSLFAILLRICNQKKRPATTGPLFWSSSSSSATELMQYRSPVGCGPSSKMCPSGRRTCCTSPPSVASRARIVLRLDGLLAGRSIETRPPEPEWYFVSERNRGWPQQTHL